MNRSIVAILAMPALALLLGSCGKAPPTTGTETALEHAARHLDAAYQCPMHPEVTSDRPGNCPVCGMTLQGYAAMRVCGMTVQRYAAMPDSGYVEAFG